MKKHILYFMLGIVVICYAITFDRIYGGTDEEYGFCVKQTNDGGYILAGSTQSSGAGGRDGWLIKTDMNGEIEWDEVSGGTLDDYFLRVEQTSDDGFIVLGAQNMDNDNGDFWLIKYDKTGKEKWSKVYQYSDSAIVGRDIQITSDDGFVIVGSKFNYNYNDLWVLKTDDRGEEVWSRTYDFGYEDYATSVIVNNTGNYVVVGSKQSYKTVLAGNDPPYMMEIQQEDILVVEINDSGAFINSNIIGSAYSDEYCYSIQNTFDSGYILTGIKNPFEYSVNTDTKDLILLKLDFWLNEDWNKIFDGNGDELGRIVNETVNNNLIILGRTT
ncbi:MAG: PQQ-like beta-propeller repeat protein, partial [Candidatus Delongbacteria bacterium]|nr:PQQ-like beta-propeller repeat protein [Candidatus Delongbacteria bacterium]